MISHEAATGMDLPAGDRSGRGDPSGRDDPQPVPQPARPRHGRSGMRRSQKRLGIIADSLLLAFPAVILMLLSLLVPDPARSSTLADPGTASAVWSGVTNSSAPATALLIGVAYGFGAAVSWVIAASHAGNAGNAGHAGKGRPDHGF